jgi:hypothetical protein
MSSAPLDKAGRHVEVKSGAQESLRALSSGSISSSAFGIVKHSKLAASAHRDHLPLASAFQGREKESKEQRVAKSKVAKEAKGGAKEGDKGRGQPFYFAISELCRPCFARRAFSGFRRQVQRLGN